MTDFTITPTPVADEVRETAYKAAVEARENERLQCQRDALKRAGGHALARLTGILAGALLSYGDIGAAGFDADAFSEGWGRYERIRNSAVRLGVIAFDEVAREAALQQVVSEAGEVEGWSARLVDQTIKMVREIRASEIEAGRQITKLAEVMIAIRAEIGDYSVEDERADYEAADDFVTRLYIERGLDKRAVEPISDWELMGV